MVCWLVGWLVGVAVAVALAIVVVVVVFVVLGFVNLFFLGSPLRDVLCSSSQDMLESGLQSTPHHRRVTEYHYRF